MRKTRLVVIGFALIALAAATVTLSTAAFTSSSVNAANGVTSGTLNITASAQGTTSVQLPYIRPGTSSQIDVEVEQKGNVPGGLKVTMTGHGTLAPYLRATAYPSSSGTPAADGPLTSPLTFDLGQTAPGTTMHVRFVFSWPSSANDRNAQGATASVDLSFVATTA